MTKSYQRGKQKSYIRGQTIQWPRDTKEVNRSRISEDRQYNDQEIPKRFFGISWSLYCLSSDKQLLVTSLASLGHCIVCSLIYEFCLPLWYMTKRYQRGKQKSHIKGQTIQWPRDTKDVNRSRILWYLLVIVLPVLWFTSSVYLFGISWSLY
jgi:hypothetical protein